MALEPLKRFGRKSPLCSEQCEECFFFRGLEGGKRAEDRERRWWQNAKPLSIKVYNEEAISLKPMRQTLLSITTPFRQKAHSVGI
jgi:hypothetical protein